MSNNSISWFEIPVSNFERAKIFYENIFNLEIKVNDFGTFKMGMLGKNLSGAICYGNGYTPSEDGTLIYIDANPDLKRVIDKVEVSGGSVITAKKRISEEIGFMGLFNDTEGNRIALMSRE